MSVSLLIVVNQKERKFIRSGSSLAHSSLKMLYGPVDAVQKTDEFITRAADKAQTPANEQKEAEDSLFLLCQCTRREDLKNKQQQQPTNTKPKFNEPERQNSTIPESK